MTTINITGSSFMSLTLVISWTSPFAVILSVVFLFVDNYSCMSPSELVSKDSLYALKGKTIAVIVLGIDLVLGATSCGREFNHVFTSKEHYEGDTCE